MLGGWRLRPDPRLCLLPGQLEGAGGLRGSVVSGPVWEEPSSRHWLDRDLLWTPSTTHAHTHTHRSTIFCNLTPQT